LGSVVRQQQTAGASFTGSSNRLRLPSACKVDSTFPYAKGALVWAGNGTVRELELCMHAAATCVDFQKITYSYFCAFSTMQNDWKKSSVQPVGDPQI